MALGWCSRCERLVEIVPGKVQREGRSSRWWHPVLHSDGKGKICEGSGERI